MTRLPASALVFLPLAWILRELPRVVVETSMIRGCPRVAAGAPTRAVTGMLGAVTDQSSPFWTLHREPQRGSTLRVDLARGSLQVTRSASAELVVEARRIAGSTDPCEVEVVAFESASVLRVFARYPIRHLVGLDFAHLHEPIDEGFERGDFWESDTQIALTVRLPAAVRLEASILSGDADIGAATADVDVVTNTGAIRVRGAVGAVRARSGSGSVDVTLPPASMRSTGSVVVRTYMGDATLHFGGGRGAALRLDDRAMPIEAGEFARSRDAIPVTLAGKVAGRRIEISAVRGGIHVVP